MKICIIDVGSNSVRLACMADGKTLYKRLATTRLGEGLSKTGVMSPAAIERTAEAVRSFVAAAREEGAGKVYVFATAAVRSAQNRAQFLERVKELCGVDVDVISGEKEAQIGLAGALRGRDGGIIDVGGASTEVTVRTHGKIVFAKSVNIGTVRLYDLAGRDRDKLQTVIEEKLEEYGNHDFSDADIYTIGGTASRLASMLHGLKEYRPEITDGTEVTVQKMSEITDRLFSMSVEEIREKTICTNSADIVAGGCLLILNLMKKFNLSKITVSESDNLEGYYMLREGGE